MLALRAQEERHNRAEMTAEMLQQLNLDLGASPADAEMAAARYRLKEMEREAGE